MAQPPKTYLTPLSDEQPDLRPSADSQRRDADLLYKRADQVRIEQETAKRVREVEVAGSKDAFGQSLAMNLMLKLAGHSKTGDVRSTFHSNNGLHNYRGAVLGMRQRILLSAAEKGEPLPANFENFSAAMVVGLFRGMTRVSYFTGDVATQEAWTNAARSASIISRQRGAQIKRHGFSGPRVDRPPQGNFADMYTAIQRVLTAEHTRDREAFRRKHGYH